jgi:hypothetical protein
MRSTSAKTSVVVLIVSSLSGGRQRLTESCKRFARRLS